jgi:hypothetical protein
VANTPDVLIKKEGSFAAIVLPEAFYTSRGISKARGGGVPMRS